MSNPSVEPVTSVHGTAGMWLWPWLAALVAGLANSWLGQTTGYWGVMDALQSADIPPNQQLADGVPAQWEAISQLPGLGHDAAVAGAIAAFIATVIGFRLPKWRGPLAAIAGVSVGVFAGLGLAYMLGSSWTPNQ